MIVVFCKSLVVVLKFASLRYSLNFLLMDLLQDKRNDRNQTDAVYHDSDAEQVPEFPQEPCLV